MHSRLLMTNFEEIIIYEANGSVTKVGLSQKLNLRKQVYIALVPFKSNSILSAGFQTNLILKIYRRR